MLPENVALKYRDYMRGGEASPGLATSEFLQGQTKGAQSYADPPSARDEATQPHLLDNVMALRFCFELCHAFLHANTQGETPSSFFACINIF